MLKKLERSISYFFFAAIGKYSLQRFVCWIFSKPGQALNSRF
jgi:hypothetical protein